PFAGPESAAATTGGADAAVLSRSGPTAATTTPGPSGDFQTLAIYHEGCFTIEPRTPWKSGSRAYGGAYWSCNVGPLTVTIIVELQQYRGLGLWRVKAHYQQAINAPFSRTLFYTWWGCAAGTGSQLYRSQTWAVNPGVQTHVYYSAQVRFTCP